MESGKTIATLISLAVLITRACTNKNHASHSNGPPSTCPNGDVYMRIESGWVCGRILKAEDNKKYASFKKLPYGKPPLKELRFKELQRVDPWCDVYDATEEGPICHEYDEIYGNLRRTRLDMSEDCITANVHIPEESIYKEDNKKLISKSTKSPIIIFIVEVGWQSGAGDSQLCGPEYLVSQGNIVITFNSRRNVFGYLYLNSTKIPGNTGLRDMITLLKWVNRNALHFGGDPDNITLGGQSTGATCVHLLSLSKATKGLFQRMIMMSGNALPQYFTASPTSSKKTADMFLQYIGINSTDPDCIHKELIKMPIEKILEANRKVQFDSGLVGFLPVVETTFPDITTVIDDEPVRLMAKGRGKHLPLMISFTSGECESIVHKVNDLDILEGFQQDPGSILPSAFNTLLPPEVRKQLGEEVIKRYSNCTLTMEEYMDCCRDTLFGYAAFKTAQWRAKMDGAPVYMYKFDYEFSYNLVKHVLSLQPNKKPGHFEDFTCLFRNAMLGDFKTFPPRNRDDLMRYSVTKIISDFMRCSAPSCCNSTFWPPLKACELNYQLLRNPVHLEKNSPATDIERSMVDFYDHLWQEARTLIHKRHHCSSKDDEAALQYFERVAAAVQYLNSDDTIDCDKFE